MPFAFASLLIHPARQRERERNEIRSLPPPLHSLPALSGKWMRSSGDAARSRDRRCARRLRSCRGCIRIDDKYVYENQSTPMHSTIISARGRGRSERSSSDHHEAIRVRNHERDSSACRVTQLRSPLKHENFMSCFRARPKIKPSVYLWNGWNGRAGRTFNCWD